MTAFRRATESELKARKPRKELTQAEARRKLLPTESDIQKACLELLDLLDIPYSVTDATRIFCKCGAVRRSKVKKSWPDVTAVLPKCGRLLALEVKTRYGKYQPGQLEMLERLLRKGALVVVARCVDDLKHALREEAGIKNELTTVR